MGSESTFAGVRSHSRFWLRMVIAGTVGWSAGDVGAKTQRHEDAESAATLSPGATPQGARVVAGSVILSHPTTTTLLVTQSSERAVIDWQSFDVGDNATVELRQPSSSSIVVVTGGGSRPAQILGSLTSNGQVVVLDANGILFGSRSSVSATAIVASTGSIDVQDLMAGTRTLDLKGITSGGIENRGTLIANDAGLVALVAARAANRGQIQAESGRVELVAGSAVTLGLPGGDRVPPVVQRDLADVAVENGGTIAADGGWVTFVTWVKDGSVNSVMDVGGVIRARTLDQKEGRVILNGGDRGTVHVGAEIDGTGTNSSEATGGYVEITGQRVLLDGATIDASGNGGGGTIHLGDGSGGRAEGSETRSMMTDLSTNTVVHADALRRGDGGTVVVWGDTHAAYHGKITARGGPLSGHGGAVDVSTAGGVVFDGFVDTTAPMGKMGKLLVDPASLTIGSSGANISAQTLGNNLTTSDAIISAFNNIDIINDIDISAGGAATHNLLLSAPVLNVNGSVVMGSGSIILQCDTLNLSGRFTSGGSLMTGSRLTGPATQVNVLQPIASLQQAMGAAASGAIIHVSPGDYRGEYSITQPVTLQGNMGDPLVAGADPAAPRLLGTTAGGTIFTSTGVANVTIEGFRLSANVNGNAASNSATGVAATADDGLVVTNDSFDGFTAYAVDVRSASNDSITYNSFANVGTGTVNAVSLTTPDIHDNIVPSTPAPAENGTTTVALAALLAASGVLLAGKRRRPDFQIN